MLNAMLKVISSEKRRKVVKTLLEYPKRLWSCPDLERLSKQPHATVYRTLMMLKEARLVATTRVNKKDIIFEVVNESPFLKELEKMLKSEKVAIGSIVDKYVKEIRNENIAAIILYGSSLTDKFSEESDIDVLVIVKKKSS